MVESENKIKGSRILVTGGAGFIGSNLVDELLAQGASEVVVIDDLSRGQIDNLQPASKTGRLIFVHGDIRDKTTLQEVFEGIDYAFHEAVIRVTRGQDDPDLCHDIVATGTANILAACVQNRVKKIILSSSTTVYGPNPDYTPIDENHHRRPSSFYGAAKVYTEHLVHAYRQKFNLNFITLRPFNVYGPRSDISTQYQEVIPVWIKRVASGQPPVIHGSGQEVYDFTNISDVVQVSMKALKSPINEGIYNVGTGKGTSLNELADLIIQLMGSRMMPIYGPTPPNQTRVKKRIADTTRAEQDLGFRAQVDLETGLKEFIAWWKIRSK